MESKAATSRLPKMSANLMNCSMTALGNSGVGGDWPASTEGTTSVRTIRARRCMRSPKMLAQRKLSRRPFERKTSAAHHASHHGDLNQAPRILTELKLTAGRERRSEERRVGKEAR